MFNRGAFFTLAVACILLFAVSALAQNTASIVGNVTDPQGAAVAGATVTVKNSQGVERTTKTDSTGNYQVPALEPDTYTVSVSASGFTPLVANNVVLQVKHDTVQDFHVQVAAASTETITVAAQAPLIDQTTMTVGQTIDQKVVQDIPLNGRHFVDLALLIPGSVTPPQNGFLTAPLRGQGSFAVNTAGNREDSVNFMVNGINLNDMVQNQVTFQPTVNTVSEFKVDNSTYSAESGRNSGAIVNIATKSGTNSFHGELYDYLRNNWFDARNAFNNKFDKFGNAIPQGPFKRNQFGGSVGGPIWHDHTFFFATYEGLRQRQTLPVSSGVLSDAQRASAVAGGNPQVNAILGFIPAANGSLPCAAAPCPPAFIGSAPGNVDIDQVSGDIDHVFSANDQLHGYYVYQHDKRTEGLQGTTIPRFGDVREGHRQLFTLGETHVFTPHLVNEFRLGVNRIHITFTPNDTTDPNALGINLGPSVPAGLPTIFINDIGLQFGAERNFPQGRGDTTTVFADSMSWIEGKHTWKFGAEFRDFRNANFNFDPGQLVFNTTAHFISGTIDSAARTVGVVANRIGEDAFDMFAQDSYKLKPYFTLELGVRYSWNMTPTEGMDRFVNFDPLTDSLRPTATPYNQNNTNFQPRGGFAWDLFHTGKTVLRGGYGFAVDQPITGVVANLTSNPPFDIPLSATALTFTTLAPAFNGAPKNLSPFAVNPNYKDANVQSWNLNIQQSITPTIALMVGYFGSKGTHLSDDININQFATLGNAATRPFTALSASSPLLPGVSLANSITLRDSGSNSTYNALWITGNKSMSHGLQFNASYTWSHSIDEVSRNNNGFIVQDSTNLRSSRGSSDFDARQRFVINSIYDLPFKGNRAISGWELAGILTLQSGNPINIIESTAGVTGAANTIRPNASGTLETSGNALTNWFTNISTLSNPGNAFGTLGRNFAVGPSFKDFDLSLIKNTKVTERVRVQFRTDAFDLTNHPNYGQPGRVISFPFNPATSTFGLISSTRFPTGDFGSSRQLQFSLRLQF